jgi:hypothetical protein
MGLRRPSWRPDSRVAGQSDVLRRRRGRDAKRDRASAPSYRPGVHRSEHPNPGGSTHGLSTASPHPADPVRNYAGLRGNRRARLPWSWQNAGRAARTRAAPQQSHGPRQQQKRNDLAGYRGGSGLRGRSGASRSPGSAAKPGSTTKNPPVISAQRDQGNAAASSPEGGPGDLTCSGPRQLRVGPKPQT